MLFLWFSGTTKNSTGRRESAEDPNANLRPSTNSAFQKYIPAANIPSTADIMSKLSSSNNSSSGSRRTSWERETGNNKVNGANNGERSSNWSASSNNKSGWGESHGRMASKVAKFCHVCGNAFPMPDIRFCCECGVKRLGVWNTIKIFYKWLFLWKEQKSFTIFSSENMKSLKFSFGTWLHIAVFF